MAKHFSAILQKIATNIRSLGSEDKQRSCKINFKKAPMPTVLQRLNPAEQKHANLTVKIKSLFSLKKGDFVTKTNRQTNNQLQCQKLADPRSCILNPEPAVLTLLSSEKGQGAKKGEQEKCDKIETKSQECGYQKRLSLVMSSASPSFGGLK